MSRYPLCSPKVLAFVVIGLNLGLLSRPALAQNAAPDPPSKTQNPKSKIEPPSPEQKELDRLLDEGDTAIDKSDFATAQQRYQTGLEKALAAGNTGMEARSLSGLGRIAVRRGQYRQALDYQNRALALREKLGDPKQIARTLNSIGVVYYYMGQFAKTLDYFSRILPIYQKLGIAEEIAGTLSNLAAVCERTSRYDSALDYQKRALPLREKLGKPEAIADSLSIIGNVYSDIGQYDRALEYYHRAQTLYEKTNNPGTMASILYNQGGLETTLGRYEQAREHLQTALTLREKQGIPAEIADSLHQMGLLFFAMGQLDKALDYETRALNLREKLNNPQALSQCYTNLGNTYSVLGQYPNALAYQRRALTLAQKIGDSDGVASVLNNMGIVYMYLQDYNRSLDCFHRALEIRKQVKNNPFLGEVLFNINLVYNRQRQYALANRYIDQALAFYGKGTGNPQTIATCWNSLGTNFYLINKYPQAYRYLKRSLAIRETLKNPEETATVLANLGMVEMKMHKARDAERHYQRAMTLYEGFMEQVGEASELSNAQGVNLSAIYLHYATLLLQQNRKVEALLLIERGRGRSLAKKAAQNHIRLESHLKPADAAELQMRNTATMEADRLLQAARSQPVPGETAGQRRLARQISEAQTRYDEASRRLSLTRDSLYARYPAYGRLQGARPPTGKQLYALSHQHPDTLYLEYAFTDFDELIIFALHDGNLVWTFLPLDQDAVAHLIQEWRTALLARHASEPILARKLSTMLLTPIEKVTGKGGKEETKKIHKEARRPGRESKGATISRIIVVPDGPLLDVPFAALRDEKGKRLIEHLPVSTSLSLGILTWPVGASQPPGVLLCAADPTGKGGETYTNETRGGGFLALPNAREESHAIVELFPGALELVGEKARKSAVKAEMPKHTLLHFATHGVADSKNGLRSALILAPEPPDSGEDGALEAREIAEMNLLAQLAVLSACETAQGQKSGGDGLLGLTWAFRAAGCPAIVASQWNVDDVATRELMVEFYKGLKAKLSKDVALQRAMLAVMRQQPQPYYWAAFTLLGDNSPLPDYALKRAANAR